MNREQLLVEAEFAGFDNLGDYAGQRLVACVVACPKEWDGETADSIAGEYTFLTPSEHERAASAVCGALGIERERKQEESCESLK